MLAVFVGVLSIWTARGLYAQPAEGEEAERIAEARRHVLLQEMLAWVERIDARAGELPALEFAAGKEWFNSAPLTFKEHLAGKITVLDFWTYCCINCIHVLPDLAELEHKYAGMPVAFVGVHSAKFENEKVSENIRDAVLRYEIEHPVINDDDMSLWRMIGVRSWPTLVVVGPKGKPLLMVSGEGNKEVLDACIAAALRYFPDDAFRHESLPIKLERDSFSAGALRYPGKLAVDAHKKHLYISDSNHNRIVVTDLDGQFVESIGSGRLGLVDGSFAEARFNRLQGIAVDGRYLYVADAENHALRRVDLDGKTVTTLAGDGSQGRDYSGGGSGRAQQLSTPWAVAVDSKHVYIAMAGTHQIWIYDKETGECRNFSGTGREQNLNDADRLLAAWAQPSGLTIGGDYLFVADSESSTVRGVDLKRGSTTTFVGGESAEPRNLFAFGDQPGVGDDARLQHNLGVLWIEEEQRVLVADTYNHRLKIMDPKARRVDNFSGTGQRGLRDGDPDEAQFSEPSGFAFHPDRKRVYVADTNNHAIRLVDLETAHVSTVELRGVPAATSAVAARSRRLAMLPGTPRVRTEPLRLRPGAVGSVRVTLRLPEGHEYSAGAPSSWQLLETGSSLLQPSAAASGALSDPASEVAIELKASDGPGEGDVTVEFVAYYCKKDGACRVGAVLVDVPVVVAADAEASNVAFDHTISDVGAGIRKEFGLLFGAEQDAPVPEEAAPNDAADTSTPADDKTESGKDSGAPVGGESSGDGSSESSESVEGAPEKG